MSGIDDIAAERKRQIEKEGWTPAHDDEHTNGELALAAVCYASPVPLYRFGTFAGALTFTDPWPADWAPYWDKRAYNGDMVLPNNQQPLDFQRRALVKAGALIAAEIDRLDRLIASTQTKTA